MPCGSAAMALGRSTRYASPTGINAVTSKEQGEADSAPVAAGDVAWHRRVEHIRGGDLGSATTQTPGMQRFEAISGTTAGSRRLWMGRSHVGPMTASGDHHHGEAETAIYIVSGHPVFVFAEGEREVRVETGPGDYVFVPPYLPHREENPSPDEEAVVVLARSTQEGIVVNLPSLWARVDRPDTQ